MAEDERTGRQMHTPSTAPAAWPREDATAPLPAPAPIDFLFRPQPLTLALTEFTVLGVG